MTKNITREDWLTKATKQLGPFFSQAGYQIPKNIRVGVGFTSKGARSNRIGECWSQACSADGTFEIFIVPTISDPVEVIAILTHEIVHAVVGLEHSHNKVFGKCARAVDLQGKLTATTAGERLTAYSKKIVKKIGAIPHATLSAGNSSEKPKQSTRMIKCECATCGYAVRTSRKWIAVAVPSCPVDGIEMKYELPADDEGEGE